MEILKDFVLNYATKCGKKFSQDDLTRVEELRICLRDDRLEEALGISSKLQEKNKFWHAADSVLERFLNQKCSNEAEYAYEIVASSLKDASEVNEQLKELIERQSFMFEHYQLENDATKSSVYLSSLKNKTQHRMEVAKSEASQMLLQGEAKLKDIQSQIVALRSQYDSLHAECAAIRENLAIDIKEEHEYYENFERQKSGFQAAREQAAEQIREIVQIYDGIKGLDVQEIQEQVLELEYETEQNYDEVVNYIYSFEKEEPPKSKQLNGVIEGEMHNSGLATLSLEESDQGRQINVFMPQ